MKVKPNKISLQEISFWYYVKRVKKIDVEGFPPQGIVESYSPEQAIGFQFKKKEKEYLYDDLKKYFEAIKIYFAHIPAYFENDNKARIDFFTLRPEYPHYVVGIDNPSIFLDISSLRNSVLFHRLYEQVKKELEGIEGNRGEMKIGEDGRELPHRIREGVELSSIEYFTITSEKLRKMFERLNLEFPPEVFNELEDVEGLQENSFGRAYYNIIVSTKKGEEQLKLPFLQ